MLIGMPVAGVMQPVPLLNTNIANKETNNMRIRDIAADLIGILCIFGLLYAGFLFGFGMGW